MPDVTPAQRADLLAKQDLPLPKPEPSAMPLCLWCRMPGPLPVRLGWINGDVWCCSEECARQATVNLDTR